MNGESLGQKFALASTLCSALRGQHSTIGKLCVDAELCSSSRDLVKREEFVLSGQIDVVFVRLKSLVAIRNLCDVKST